VTKEYEIDRPLTAASGVNGQVELLNDRVRIRRAGLVAVLSQGLKGDKEILLSSITSIMFKKAGWAFNGYIRFHFMGGAEGRGGILRATRDENTIMFNSFQQKPFEALKIAIEQRMTESKNQTTAPSYLDELEKLAALRDKGIITEEEFIAKKIVLLGLPKEDA
jgi:hypothetical protein